MSQEDCFYLGIKALILNEDKKLLLLQRNQSKNWDLPGGRLQQGESPLEALKREVFEETGISFKRSPLQFAMGLTQIRIGDRGLLFSTYLYHAHETPKISLSKEHFDYRWVFLSEAQELLPPEFPENIRNEISRLP